MVTLVEVNNAIATLNERIKVKKESLEKLNLEISEKGAKLKELFGTDDVSELESIRDNLSQDIESKWSKYLELKDSLI